MERNRDAVRYVVPNSRGGWDVRIEIGVCPAARARTRGEAISLARAILDAEGGGEIRVAARQGSFEHHRTPA